MSKVVIVRGKHAFRSDGAVDQNTLIRMYNKGFNSLTGDRSIRKSLQSMLTANDKVGIKINTLGGKLLTTRPEVSLSLAKVLSENGFKPENILIWDRTNQELRASGYRLNMNRKGIKIFGTDSKGVGYEADLTSHMNIGSLMSIIQANMIESSISLAVLKDHGLAGVTAGMKNYFGAIHNPNKYHDTRCDPYIAELFDVTLIKKKHKISILDCLTVQYHRGPSFHPKWAEKCSMFIFSQDPVAADFTGWQIIEKLRAKKGLPSLKEEKREPIYLKTAEKMGLGKANAKDIITIEEAI